MIPNINDIIKMLLVGECSVAQAESWIQTHINRERSGLRDEFAAHALQAIIAKEGPAHIKNRAKDAYLAADAMLEAREAK